MVSTPNEEYNPILQRFDSDSKIDSVGEELTKDAKAFVQNCLKVFTTFIRHWHFAFMVSKADVYSTTFFCAHDLHLVFIVVGVAHSSACNQTLAPIFVPI
jgi:hypothetical protein